MNEKEKDAKFEEHKIDSRINKNFFSSKNDSLLCVAENHLRRLKKEKERNRVRADEVLAEE